jgi:hypothetical protein
MRFRHRQPGTGSDIDDDPARFRVTLTFDEQNDGKTVLTLRLLHPTSEQRAATVGFGAVELGMQNHAEARPSPGGRLTILATHSTSATDRRRWSALRRARLLEPYSGCTSSGVLHRPVVRDATMCEAVVAEHQHFCCFQAVVVVVVVQHEAVGAH